MGDFVQRSNLRKNYEIFISRMNIAIKSGIEYKINFWMMNGFDLFHVISSMVFYFIISNFASEIIRWNLIDFFLFWLLNLLSWKILWFHNLRNFASYLLRGQLNIHLTKPVNTYFLASMELMNGQNIISLLYVVPLVIAVIIYSDYSNYFLSLMWILFSWMYFMVFFNFFNSFDFFMKKANMLTGIPFILNHTLVQFIPKMFDESPIKKIVYIIPVSVHAYLVVEILRGNIAILLLNIYWILSTFFLLSIGLYLLWHFGLKRYEAFG